jgi:NADPH-dependent F420 reductase
MMENPNKPIQTIAIAGGTGKEGKGLAYRWTKAGYHVIIGSRTLEKAEAAAADVRTMLDADSEIRGMLNVDAAAAADIVVMTVPYAAHKDTLLLLKPHLTGKILVDVTVPLVPPKITKVQMPPAGSAAMEAREILGEGYEIASAFQNISYEHLREDEPVECDVLVTGTGKGTRQQIIQLVKDAGLIGWDAGPIENSVVVEGMTSILLGLNKQYSVQSAGIRITGIPGD